MEAQKRKVLDRLLTLEGYWSGADECLFRARFVRARFVRARALYWCMLPSRRREDASVEAFPRKVGTAGWDGVGKEQQCRLTLV